MPGVDRLKRKETELERVCSGGALLIKNLGRRPRGERQHSMHGVPILPGRLPQASCYMDMGSGSLGESKFKHTRRNHRGFGLIRGGIY